MQGFFVRCAAALLAALLAAPAPAAEAGSFRLPEGHPSLEGRNASARPRLPRRHPPVSRESGTLFELISAGIAYHRNDPVFAATALASAARRERDPEIARMAWEAAASSRDAELLLSAAEFWLQVDPSAEPAHQTLVAAAVESGSRESLRKALASMDAALSKTSGDGTWLGRLLRLFARSRQSEASLFLSEAGPFLQKYEGSGAVLLGRAQLERAAGDAGKACAWAKRAQRADAGNAQTVSEAADLCWVPEPDETRRMLQSFLQKHPDEALVRLVLGRLEARLGRLDEAREALDQAVRHAGDDLRILFSAGQLAADCQDPVRTEALLSKYVECLRRDNPEVDLSHAEVWIMLGNAAMMQKDPKRAAGYFGELEGGPYAPQARVREAIALTDAGDFAAARGVLARARTEIPSEAGLFFSAEAKLLMERDEADEACRVLSEALEAFPEETDLLYEAAMAAQTLGRTAESERFLERLLKVSPEHVQANNALGYLWVEQKRNLPRARELIEKAYRASPMDPFILDSMGWLCFQEGRPRAAYEFLQTSLKKNYDPEVACHMIEVLVALNRRAEAERILADVVERSGVSPEVEALVARLRLKTPHHAEGEK